MKWKIKESVSNYFNKLREIHDLMVESSNDDVTDENTLFYHNLRREVESDQSLTVERQSFANKFLKIFISETKFITPIAAKLLLPLFVLIVTHIIITIALPFVT